VVGLQTRRRAWLWLFHREAAWDPVVVQGRTPSEVQGAELELEGLPSGPCRFEWWDTREGKVIREEPRTVENGRLRLAIPAFSRDLAGKVILP
jgi:hypothetical protein